MPRTLRPELLDSLAPDDPAARHNRRDLRIINRVLRSQAWFDRQLASGGSAGAAVLEIGAGEGELLTRLRARGHRVDGLDLWPRPPVCPPGALWHQQDVRNFERWEHYPVVMANLIFHQFDAEELRTIGERIAGARLLVVQEPARVMRAKAFLALGGALLGANHVTRHDGPASVDAGFIGDELPAALGLERHGWSWRATVTVWGTCRLVAQRA